MGLWSEVKGRITVSERYVDLKKKAHRFQLNPHTPLRARLSRIVCATWRSKDLLSNSARVKGLQQERRFCLVEGLKEGGSSDVNSRSSSVSAYLLKGLGKQGICSKGRGRCRQLEFL